MRNAVWDGHRVSLVGARNEIIAFQVIVEAGDLGIDGLTLSLPELRSSGGAVIRYQSPQKDPTLTRDRPIQLFALNYMHVTEASHADWVWKPGSAAAPRDMLGWRPVQLVPEQARAGRGGFPLRVRAHERQAFAIEIYTGRERPAGSYVGIDRRDCR